jgi:hypothetical protein
MQDLIGGSPEVLQEAKAFISELVFSDDFPEFIAAVGSIAAPVLRSLGNDGR